MFSTLKRLLAALPMGKIERLIVIVAIYQWIRQLMRTFTLDKLLDSIPGAAGAIKGTMRVEADKAVKDLFPASLKPDVKRIPDKGLTHEAVIKQLSDFQSKDKFNRQKGFGLVYTISEDSKHEDLTTRAYGKYIATNALDPTAFPSLRKMEVEVCQMTLDMLHAPEGAAATMTSGGTESILCAVKAYRDRARAKWPHITEPEMLLPLSAHVAFEKGCHYFGIKPVWVPLDPVTQNPDMKQMESLITKNTVVLVASAVQYPAGTMDPVSAISDLAIKNGLPLHVDGCIGGFLLPFVEKLGYEVPKWDFRVPGVTSISADIHKYGYAPKGASVISWRSDDDRLFQFHAYAGWPGGYYASPSLLGTRAGGSIAAAWASMMAMGQEGFKAEAKKTMFAAKTLQAGIKAIDGLEIVGTPVMSIVCFSCTDRSLHEFAIADVMEKKGWKISRQQNPNSLHMTMMPVHAQVADQLVADLRDAVNVVRNSPDLINEGSAAMYGVLAKIPTDAKVADFLKILFARIFAP